MTTNIMAIIKHYIVDRVCNINNFFSWIDISWMGNIVKMDENNTCETMQLYFYYFLITVPVS